MGRAPAGRPLFLTFPTRGEGTRTASVRNWRRIYDALYLALPQGIPSHDTFARVLARLKPEELQRWFLHWIRAVSELTQGAVVASDGTTLRRSFDRATGKGAIHLVSAWAPATRLVLGQRKVDEQANEITASPALWRLLDLEGGIVTLDARGVSKRLPARLWSRERTPCWRSRATTGRSLRR